MKLKNGPLLRHLLGAFPRRIRPTGATSAILASLTALLIAILLGPSAAWASKEGLVGAYSFDEGTGEIVNDLSGNENDGALNGPAWSGAKSSYGWALNFDGVNDCVAVPNLPEVHLDKAFTFEAWVRPEAKSIEEANQSQAIFSKEGAGFGDIALGLSLMPGRKLSGVVNEGAPGESTHVEGSTAFGWNLGRRI